LKDILTLSDKHHKSSWKSRSSLAVTPWGSEIRWAATAGVNGKCLSINKGMRTSLKYYKLKDEVLFLYKGKILVTHGDEKTITHPETHPYVQSILAPGEMVIVQSHCPYRIEALEDSEVIEIGSRGPGDTVMLEDDFGRADKADKEL